VSGSFAAAAHRAHAGKARAEKCQLLEFRDSVAGIVLT
jgi:hypothetical protein